MPGFRFEMCSVASDSDVPLVGFATPCARSEHFLTASLDGTMRIWDMKLGLRM